ncbi:WD repeat-containing protein 18 isoform X2 [Oryzias melastigma]|uniref:WD repeat-containing protein 18 isoform X2 n=1 Tax=Oryzias melastigma TaxID=30732 RepID=UPI00168CFFE1|nr:WD repeat-containing protein 18 isoform X2 [Oryzias melastigma]
MAGMATPLEVIVSADAGSQLWNLTVFDLHSGSSLLSYRGGNSAARSLTVLRGEFLLSAQLAKNYINVWEIQRKDQLQQKIVCPGMVTCLTASPDGVFLAAGVGEALHLWEVSTGKLLCVLSRHYQDITCLKFTDDGSHFISGGKDNLALVWNLWGVIQLDASQAPEPRHVLSRHSLPITDLHCGCMGAQARVATASLDQTVKVWELSSGELLLSVLFDVEIMSVTCDPCEYFLFCGGSDGNIFQVSLCSQGLVRERSFQSDSEGSQVLKGHGNMVTCLSVSMDGTLLLSGSHDETVRVWDIQSKQSIRCLAHKGPVTNAVIMPAPANMFLPDSRPAVPLPRFSRHLHTTEDEGGEAGEICVRPALYTQEEETYLQKAEQLHMLMTAVTDRFAWGDSESTKADVAELKEEVQYLNKVNRELYEFSTQLLTKPT